MWIACDNVTHFNLKIAHSPWENNTDADYLSRLERQNYQESTWGIENPTIEINVQSADVTVEEQLFFTTDDETEEQYLAF